MPSFPWMTFSSGRSNGQRKGSRHLGENVDHERVLSVLKAIKEKGKASYQPYDCHAKKLLAPVFVPKKDVLLVEGSYSQHPSLVPYYDLKIFLDIDPTEQLRRLEKRVGKERLLDFIHRWIPMEEGYFSFFHIKENSDIVFSN